MHTRTTSTPEKHNCTLNTPFAGPAEAIEIIITIFPEADTVCTISFYSLQTAVAANRDLIFVLLIQIRRSVDVQVVIIHKEKRKSPEFFFFIQKTFHLGRHYGFLLMNGIISRIVNEVETPCEHLEFNRCEIILELGK